MRGAFVTAAETPENATGGLSTPQSRSPFRDSILMQLHHTCSMRTRAKSAGAIRCKDSEPTRMPLEHKLAVCGADSARFSRPCNSEYLVPIFILDRKGPDVAHAGEGQHQEAYARLSNSSVSQQVPSCPAARTGARWLCTDSYCVLPSLRTV